MTYLTNPQLLLDNLDQPAVMFIAIVGTRGAGKSEVEKYLVSSKGFTSVRLTCQTDLVEVSIVHLSGDDPVDSA